jgi:hypothetical protein
VTVLYAALGGCSRTQEFLENINPVSNGTCAPSGNDPRERDVSNSRDEISILMITHGNCIRDNRFNHRIAEIGSLPDHHAFAQTIGSRRFD